LTGVDPGDGKPRLGLLGCGGFGAVELVEETKSGDVSLSREGPTM
jgi:hypothetical protein